MNTQYIKDLQNLDNLVYNAYTKYLMYIADEKNSITEILNKTKEIKKQLNQMIALNKEMANMVGSNKTSKYLKEYKISINNILKNPDHILLFRQYIKK